MNSITAAETQTIQPAPELSSQMAPINPMMRMIEAVVQNPDLPLDRLEKIMEIKNAEEDRQLEKEMRSSRKAYFAAMAQCQAEMPRVSKNQSNTHTKSRYADLGAVLEAAQPIIAKFGFSVSFHPAGVEDGNLIMAWTVSHAEGHQETGRAGYPLDAAGSQGKVNKTGVQALASTETYARRYLLLSLFNIATSDDKDGNAAPEVKTPISADQFRELRDLIERAGITEEVVCTAEGIGELHELPAAKFGLVKSKMNKTIENKAKTAEETA